MAQSSIIIKFKPGAAPRYVDGAHSELSAPQRSNWDQIARGRSDLSIERRFKAISAQELENLEGIASGGLPNDQTLADYFTVMVPEGENAQSLLARILEWPDVELAFIEPLATTPAVAPGDDPRFSSQGYLQPAPSGIDAVFGWSIRGGDGEGQHVVDIEQGWTLDHEDLVAKGARQIHGGTRPDAKAHGTSVLGELCMVDNAIGGVGIVPGLTNVLVASTEGSSVANAILASAAYLTNDVKDVGVILIEQQWVDWLGWKLMIVETADDVFSAIRLATQLGHLVVEAAGNGAHDLDTYQSSNRYVLRRSSSDFKDSGALVVGASTSRAPHSRMNFSNHGSRIDCYGWGEGVETASSNASGATHLYSRSFGGTSSASPIVTGAALAVQGMKRASHDGTPLNPATLRAILSDSRNGTPSSSPSDRIGVMPNIRRIAGNVLNLAPELYIRDTINDAGTPHSGIASASPDIIIRQREVSNPEAAFGAGSGTERSVDLSDAVEFGSDHFGYVRIQNRAAVAAGGAVVTLYWSPPSTLPLAPSWRLIGSRSIDVPARGEMVVAGPFNWPRSAVPPSGHYCFIATVSHGFDMAPAVETLNPIHNFAAFIQANNNVAWRNFNVVDIRPYGPTESVVMPFEVPRPDPESAADMRVVLESRLPSDSRLFLTMPEHVHPSPGLNVHPGRAPGTIRVELPPNGVVEPFLGDSLPPITWMELEAEVGRHHWHGSYEIFARQFYRDVEIGRITWLLRLPTNEG